MHVQNIVRGYDEEALDYASAFTPRRGTTLSFVDSSCRIEASPDTDQSYGDSRFG